MLKKIKVSNFFSIGQEQELTMEICSKDILDNSAIEISSGKQLNLASCIIGANASGKTNILKAISFLYWFINESYTSLKSENPIPLSQHKFMLNKPTRIEIEFYNNKLSYTYKIELNSNKVLKESLEKEGARNLIFELERTKDSVKINSHQSLKINETDKTRFMARENVPLLSSLIDTGYLPEITFFKNFTTNVNQLGRADNNFHIPTLVNVSRELQTNEKTKNSLLSFSKEIDLGLSGFEFGKLQFTDEKNPTKQEEMPLLKCIHTLNEKEFSLPLFAESNGTQHYVYLYLKILPMLEKGGLVVLDEIESGIHLDAVKKIISLFENRETNPHGAQLIFSTHQLPLLNDRTKTQIFISEKNKMLETEIYRLDDLEGIRNDENYFNKYIAGAYGGIPNIDWLGRGKIQNG